MCPGYFWLHFVEKGMNFNIPHTLQRKDNTEKLHINNKLQFSLKKKILFSLLF